MAKYKFIANIVHREIDTFDQGCDPDTSITQFFGCEIENIEIVAGSLFGLIAQIRQRFNVSMDAILLNSCEENGRLDIQTYTKGDRSVVCAYHHYAKRFKAGECTLYLNNISGTVTEITPPPALDLGAIWQAENDLKRI